MNAERYIGGIDLLYFQNGAFEIMAKMVIGYRRLYKGVGCDLGKYKTIEVVEPVGDVTIQAFLSDEPVLDWYERHGQDHFIIGQKVGFHGKISREDAGSASPDMVYSDIFFFKEVDVSEELSVALHANDATARNEALRLASEDAELVLASDVACGTIGLRLHGQFVTDLIFDAFYAGPDGDRFSSSYGFIAPQGLNPVLVIEEATNSLNTDLETAGNPERFPMRRKALALNWLLRGWAEKDRISKFVAFFTAIEIILGGYQGEQYEADEELLMDIRSLIENYGGGRAASMLTVMSRLRLPAPSLTSRFEEMAKAAKIDGWENDIGAFGKFNRLRNNLVHRGDQSVTLSLSVGESEIANIEQIATRYVNWSIFRDAAVHSAVVYASRWPKRESGIQITVQLMLPSYVTTSRLPT